MRLRRILSPGAARHPLSKEGNASTLFKKIPQKYLKSLSRKMPEI
jgi:hypothetical protein